MSTINKKNKISIEPDFKGLEIRGFKVYLDIFDNLAFDNEISKERRAEILNILKESLIKNKYK